jgi:hypothetical protein
MATSAVSAKRIIGGLVTFSFGRNYQADGYNLRFQHVQSSLQGIAVQVEQLVFTLHQIQENKMSRDDVQLVAPCTPLTIRGNAM